MTDVRDSIADGYYARRLIYSRDPLIGWSHRRRFRTGAALARAFAGGRVLDYGCGDGTFLALLDASDAAPAFSVGAEIDPRIVIDCRRRFATRPRLRFVDVAQLDTDDAGSYDAIFCMEVLEHVTDPQPLFDDFDRLLQPGGTLVISVPIETGLPLLVKQVVRRAAGRRVKEYPGTSAYTQRELVKSMLAARTQHIPRPVFHRPDGASYHDHKGFNWRVLREAVAARFDLVRTVTSPFNWTGPGLGTQVFFTARKRNT